MSFNKFVNTRYFSEAATDWHNNGGSYCRAQDNSREFEQYWTMQEERCMKGYRVADLWISGRAYFYLNFFPMSRVRDEDLTKIVNEQRRRGKISTMTAEKIMTFPKFWEIDYEWWNLKQVSWYGGSFQTSRQMIVSPGGKHLSCLKTRGAGFSYKEAADGIYNYIFYPGSKSYYFAAIEAYLNVDGILNKVQPGLDWINDYCPWWRQNRQVKKTTLHQRASFLDSQGQERGTMSEIIGVTVDKPSKTRGKRGRKIVFEESGAFVKLKQALAIALGTLRDGGIYVGQASVFGTGGEEGPEIEGLEHIFGQPEIYDMLEFENVWDVDALGTYCGYFVPYTHADFRFMDEDGNIDIAAAEKDHAAQEKKLEQAQDLKELDRFQAEYPANPSQALNRLTGNPFLTQQIKRQIKILETDRDLQAILNYGHMTKLFLEPVFVIKPKQEAKPIEEYPHNTKDDLTGCVTIREEPIRINGSVPEDVYKLILDPYAIEEAEDRTSLFAGGVFKMDNPYDQINVGLEMAWYAGRPSSIYEAYEQILYLALYYNARIQSEIAGGGQAFLNYARDRGYLHLLLGEPESAQNRDAASKRTGYFMNMATDRKRLGLTYLVDWHKRMRGIDELGRIITTIERTMNIGFLRELAVFNAKKNADRVSYHITAMFEMKEAQNDLIEEVAEATDDYWNRPFFSEAAMQDTDSFITPY